MHESPNRREIIATDRAGAGSQWKSVYDRYRELERGWSLGLPRSARACARSWERAIFRRLVRPGEPLDQIASDVRKTGLSLPSAWDQVAELRVPLQQVREDKMRWDAPLDDVYEAALAMVLGGPDWWPFPDLDQVYRGYRDCKWPIIPGLFRGWPSRREMDQHLDRLRGMVGALRSAKPQLSEEQAVAILQHYQDEAQVKTWLLDFTWDPLIALYFASAGGVADDVGRVIALGFAEWQSFATGNENPMGEIEHILISGVRRIERQRALFVHAPRPQLFDQFVPYEIRFHQKTGLAFEDAGRKPPVTRKWLTPDRDRTSDEIRALKPVSVAPPLRTAPAAGAEEPLEWQDYLRMVRCWCTTENWQIKDFDRILVVAACRFYARLQQEPVDPDLKSIHRLREAVEKISRDPGCDLDDAFDKTLGRRPPIDPQRQRLLDLIYRARRTYT